MGDDGLGMGVVNFGVMAHPVSKQDARTIDFEIGNEDVNIGTIVTPKGLSVWRWSDANTIFCIHQVMAYDIVFIQIIEFY